MARKKLKKAKKAVEGKREAAKLKVKKARQRKEDVESVVQRRVDQVKRRQEQAEAKAEATRQRVSDARERVESSAPVRAVTFVADKAAQGGDAAKGGDDFFETINDVEGGILDNIEDDFFGPDPDASRRDDRDGLDIDLAGIEDDLDIGGDIDNQFGDID